MTFMLGTLQWHVVLVNDYIEIDGNKKYGASSLVLQTIFISTLPKPEQRTSILWHELGHALKDTLDIHDQDHFDIEGACNLVGMLPKMMSLHQICLLSSFVMSGVESEDFRFVDRRFLVPVVNNR